ncbi:hypothetical protein CBR_g49420 [Chara braunii]|uniref:CCHC-type domain-containing protein n=1 Tax=Chara braunii TaxID=69332 RepID=A0A388M518_CHABU|nr:hypothetical protein CBR_g49420 [Chara braunii]|eukprot:GBG89630.1 hypothetical protein CBR_g49420 [Chara braunii]
MSVVTDVSRQWLGGYVVVRVSVTSSVIVFEAHMQLVMIGLKAKSLESEVSKEETRTETQLIMANPQQGTQQPFPGFNANPVPMNTAGLQAGSVSCHLCGKYGHYARNCWAAGNGRRPQHFQHQQHTAPGMDDETSEMKAFFRKKIQKQKAEEERRERDREEQKKRLDEEKREADRLREAEAREARLEARLVRLMTQHTKSVNTGIVPVARTKSPKSKARMLREICSYIDESEDESDEVREEAGRLIDAIERRKGKRKIEGGKALSASRPKTTRACPIIVEDVPDDVHTPPAKRRGVANDTPSGDMLEYIIEMHRSLSAKKAPELKKICNEEGIEWTRKDQTVSEIVRCRAKLAYGEVDDSAHLSSLAERGHCPWAKKWIDMLGEEVGDLTTKGSGIYVLVSPWCRHTYVGRTMRNFILRWSEHVKLAIAGKMGNAPKLHAWLRVFGWDKYLVLPVMVQVSDPLVIEKAPIKRYSPAMNTHGRCRDGRKSRRRKGKRERGQRGVNKIQGRMITFNKTASLIDLLKGFLGSDGQRSIVSSGGDVWADRWRVVKGKVGESTLRVSGNVLPIKMCRRVLEARGTFDVDRIKITSSAVEHGRYVLRDLLAQLWRVKDLYRKGSAELIALYRTASTFGRKCTRNQLKITITRVIRKVHGFEVRNRPRVKMPFSTNIISRNVRDLAARALEGLISDLPIRRYIVARTRVVFSRRRNVGQVIHNQRRWAGMQKAVFTCGDMDLPRARGHVKVRLDEIPATPSFVKNSKNVTCGDDLSPGKLRECIVSAIRPWNRGRPVLISDGDLRNCMKTQARRSTQALTTQEVLLWSRSIEQLVTIPIDRNPGASLVVCPVLYLHACELTFNANPSYLPVREEEGEIIGRMKAAYTQTGLTRIAAWGKGGEVGHAYVLPKDKDLDRWRPIAPATKDPVRLVGSRVGRAIRFMLFGIGDGRHFDLRSMNDLRKQATCIQTDIRRVVDRIVA